MSSMDTVVFEKVSKQFDGKANAQGYAVRDLSFSVKKGEMVAIVGKTGCGKSTAFNLLTGLIRPTSGKVRVLGKDPFENFGWFRGRFGIVFQSDRLLPWRTALENVCMGLEILGTPHQERVNIAREWLERLGLGGYENAYPYALSGGMKQRVSIARAFAVNPDIVLCDEAFSALDELTANVLRAEFRDLVRRHEKTGLFITHSIHEALTLGQRILVFRKPGHVALELQVPQPLDSQQAERLKAEILKAMGNGSDKEDVQ